MFIVLVVFGFAWLVLCFDVLLGWIWCRFDFDLIWMLICLFISWFLCCFDLFACAGWLVMRLVGSVFIVLGLFWFWCFATLFAGLLEFGGLIWLVCLFWLVALGIVLIILMVWVCGFIAVDWNCVGVVDCFCWVLIAGLFGWVSLF